MFSCLRSLGWNRTPLAVAGALQGRSAAMPGVKPQPAPPQVSFSSSQSRGQCCHKASLMISSPWAGGVTAASGGSPPSLPVHPTSSQPYQHWEYSGPCWIMHGLGTVLKKESGKRELLSLAIPKSKSGDPGVKFPGACPRPRGWIPGRAPW